MIVNKENSFESDKCLNLCLIRCKELGIRAQNFTKLVKEYKIKLANLRGIAKGNKTKFMDQPIELNCGDWICDISGVKKNQMNASGNYETKFASPIPVLVTERLKNIDNDTEKIKLAFFKEGWQTLICNRSTVASNTKIVELADKGLEVNSDNAKLLVKYIADLVALNLDTIPIYNATSKLGWTDKDFVPYSDIRFDGESEYKSVFDAVSPSAHGSYDEWVQYTGKLRKNKYLRLQMAASFAAPIIPKVNALPFILHFWGGTGNGKTVGLMVAMSIWGNPRMGKLVRTMNMTVNNMVSTAALLNNIPFAGDELQLIKSNMGYDKLIMQCTEGIGRGRMKYDKIQELQTWKTSFIFTGEEPITKDNSGGGAKNRVIEFECTKKVIENGNEVVSYVQNNYGFAGEKFTKAIADEKLQEEYSQILKKLLECDTTEKQAMAMSCMLLADKMACKYIYTGEKPLEVSDVKEFLKTNKEVDQSERAYEWVLNFVAVNNNKFQGNEMSECWGKIDDEYIYINKNILTAQMNDNTAPFDSVKTKWAEKGYLITNSQGRFVHSTKCYGIKGMYIKIQQKPEEVNIVSNKIPF